MAKWKVKKMQDGGSVGKPLTQQQALWKQYQALPKEKQELLKQQYLGSLPLLPLNQKPITPQQDTTKVLKQPVPTSPNTITIDALYNKWPALKNLGGISIKADTTFTRDNTGVGDIEYFAPGKVGDRNTVIYDNGFEVAHPKPGTHGIVYNPKTNDEQSIRLDLLHGMKDADPVYAKQREEFSTAFQTKFPGYLPSTWKWATDKWPGIVNDGYNAFKNNEIDGQIRALLFEGNRDAHSYSEEEVQARLADPTIKKRYTQIKNYLESKGKGYMLPEITIKPKEIPVLLNTPKMGSGGKVTIGAGIGLTQTKRWKTK